MSAQQKTYIPYLALFALVFISRFPFLSAGYGVEEDSWGIALAAFHTKITGVYEPSRFPGHPVQELIYSAIWGVGPFLFNALCALMSAIATVYFAAILKHLNFKYFFWAALAFAFVPVVFISSTYTIDFMWSEAFVLMSFYYVLTNKLPIAGILLGLAVGCRITSGIMVLPYIILIWNKVDLKATAMNFLKIALPMSLVIVLAFLPIMFQFGTSFFMYYDQFPYPPLTKVLYKMIPGVWGFVGVVAISVSFYSAVFRAQQQNRGALFLGPLNEKIIFISFLLIVLYCISYFRLPQKSGYMLPVVPFVILLFGYYLNANNFKLLCYALIVSSFVCSINLTDKLRGASHSKFAITINVSGQELFFDIFSGPVFSDYSKRKQKINYTNEVLTQAASMDEKAVLISGWWYNELMVTQIGKSQNPAVLFEPYINQQKIEDYASKGYSIYYLPEQNTYNDLMYKMSVTNDLAKPF